MSKPLTIDELKTLREGDWVWVEVINVPNGSFRGYYQIRPNAERSKLIFCGIEHDYSIMDYGKTWLAFKNKEQAEAKDDVYKEYNEIYDYLYDYLNNAATCITQKDTNVVRIEVDAWLEFDLVIDLSDAKYFDDDTMTWKELRGAK